MGKKEKSSQVTEKIPAWDLPDVPKGRLPDAPIHYSGAQASIGVDNKTSRLEDFRRKLRVEVINLDEDDMEFDIIGIDSSIANAFRRILISEVPTMAIEHVFIANNTSVIPDEVLSLRLGLIPLNVDPRLFDYKSENDEPNEKNTIVFKLHARCKRSSEEELKKKHEGKEDEFKSEYEKKRITRNPRLNVTSKELVWLPNGSELLLNTEDSNLNLSLNATTYTPFSRRQDSMPEFSNNPIAPKYNDIVIAKLGATQEIELEAHAVKGLGKTHAKWSPVATAWYRMLPEVVLLQEIKNEKAEELVKKCPVKVFDIEDVGKKGYKRAIVAKPRSCTLCRECIRGDGWDQLVALKSVKDHFIFKIESTGALPPEVLFTEAVKVLEDKCDRVLKDLS